MFLPSFCIIVLTPVYQDCNQVVAEKFFSLQSTDGKIDVFCEKDYFKRLDLLCAKCGGALRGPHINALNKKYHLEHFSCSSCSTIFRQHDSYYERDGQVFCQFHYSVLFASKCKGCQTAVLQKFVEISKEGGAEHWHPSCYMIYKLWSVRLNSSRYANLANLDSPVDGVVMDDNKKQQQTVEKADRILSVLSTFEESSAECISEMLVFFSNNRIENGIEHAGKFIGHVEALFVEIDSIESQLSSFGDKTGLQLTREPKQLAKKVVNFFSLLSQTANHNEETTRDLINLVTTLAHVLKILIRGALNGALKLERNFGSASAVTDFLDHLHSLDEMVFESEFNQTADLKNDLCPVCKKSVEEECFKFENRRWHALCFVCQECGVDLDHNLQFAFCDDRNLKEIRIYCHSCAPPGSRTGFVKVTQLEQYTFLLRCALKRLCLLLKVRDQEVHNQSFGKPLQNQISIDQLSSFTGTTPANDSIHDHNVNMTSRPRKPYKYISELPGLAHLVVRQWAVMQMHPLVAQEIPDLNQLMEYVESKPVKVWRQLVGVIQGKQKQKDGTFGVPLDILVERYGVDIKHSSSITTRIPIIMDQCIQHLQNMDLTVEGIFRKSGNIRNLKIMSELLDNDPLAINLSEETPVQLAALMKKFLRELPEPLLTFKLHKLFILSQKLETEELKKEVLHLVVCLLPKPNLDLLIVLSSFMREVAGHSDTTNETATDEGHATTGNRMNILNLARVLTPNVLYSKIKNQGDQDVLLAIECFAMLLRYQDEFWLIPKNLAKELETNWPDVMDPEHISSRSVMKEMLERIKNQPEEHPTQLDGESNEIVDDYSTQ
ncbi:hypothetical protein HK096_001248 [Nowakowskiella sp. JEL0078]|nr:hypothetical protein HK096_001248 [Nowakowskiella sp. JEL0078]